MPPLEKTCQIRSELVPYCFDMHLQKHLNSRNTVVPGRWPRALSSRVVNGFIRCELDPRRTYEFMKVYRTGPHLAFLNAKTEDALLAFSNTWGPLSIPDGSPDGESIILVRHYRQFQRRLEATLGLFESCRVRRHEKEALVEFISAHEEDAEDLGTFSTASFFFQLSENLTASEAQMLSAPLLREWPLSLVRSAIQNLIDKVFTFSVGMRVDPRSGRMSAGWDISSLEDALRWMICQDALSDLLPQVCPECKNAFRPAYHHKKKFCTNLCAQRCAARTWAQRARGTTARKTVSRRNGEKGK
jgi:hypothetical protein